MRNTIKTIAALLIVLSAAKSSANVDSTNVGTYCKVVAQAKEDSYKLIYSGIQKGEVAVQWVDEKNQVIYKENVKSDGAFVKQYSLSTLPDGKYTLQLSAGDYKFAEEVILGDLSAFKFSFRKLSDKSIAMTGTQPVGKMVTVYIMDENSDTIFSETITDKEFVQKKYNLESLSTNKVTFMVYSGNKMVTQESFTF